MPQCYGIIMSISSSLHHTTQMWNLHGLVDHIQTRHVPIALPLETHVFWSFAPEELGVSFEARLVLSVEMTRLEPSEPLVFRAATPYTHLRLRGVALDRVGEYHASIEWRRTEAREWTREAIFWPFMVSLEEATP
jgi:hypothetical protein